MTSASLRLRVRLLCVLLGLGVTLAAQAPVEFDAASLKRNTSNQLPTGRAPDPATGEFRQTLTLANLILRGYPLATTPPDIQNLPSWTRDLYDFVAKSRPQTTAAEQQQMYRALLADRLKLAAHYETHTAQGYNLVFARANKSLGPGLKPSTLNCAEATGRPTPGSDIVAFAQTHCGMSMTDFDGTMYSGGLTLQSLTQMMSRVAGRPVYDKTGLQGFYEVKFKFDASPQFASPGRAPSPDDPPSLFTAAPEQLGLKLESSQIESQVLVIDHIERPSEN